VFPLKYVSYEGAGDNHLLCSLLLAMTAEYAVAILIELSSDRGVHILTDLLAETIGQLLFGQLSHRDGCLSFVLWSAGVQHGSRPCGHPDRGDVFRDWCSIQPLRRHAGECIRYGMLSTRLVLNVIVELG